MMIGDRPPTIFYDGEAGTWEKRLIIAHEIGHLIYGHFRKRTTRPLSGEAQEQAADMFSTVFTALMLYDEYRQKQDHPVS